MGWHIWNGEVRKVSPESHRKQNILPKDVVDETMFQLWLLLLRRNSISQKPIKKERTYVAHSSTSLSSLKEGRTEAPTGQESGGRADKEAMEGSCSLTCSPWLAQPVFLPNLGPPARDSTTHVSEFSSPNNLGSALKPHLRMAFSQLSIPPFR